MIPVAEHLSDIKSRMREIAKSEGRRDEDVTTAADGDLDVLASAYDLSRAGGEADDQLRARVMAAASKRARW